MTGSVDWAFEQRPGNAAAKLVLLTLAHEGWECRLSQAEIAAETGLSLASVARSLRLLESSALIRREAQHDGRGYRAPDRFVLLPVTQPGRQADGQERSPSSEQHVTQPGRLSANQALSQPGRLTGRTHGPDLPTRHTAWQAERRSNKDSPTESLSVEGGVGGDRSPAAAQPKAARRRPETPIPDIFQITTGMRAWAAQHARRFTIDLDGQTERFVNHARQSDRRVRDWNAAWRNWILKAQDFADQDAARQEQAREVVEVTGDWDV